MNPIIEYWTPIEATIEYWKPRNKTVRTDTGYTYLDKKSEQSSVEVWSGTKEEIFKKFEKEQNTLKYCNGHYYKFKDKKLEEEQHEWYKNLPEHVRFNMYYGNGVVD